MLGQPKAYKLHYHGRGCGGANLPFDSIAQAVAYAKQCHATSFEIESTASGEIIARGSRPDARHRLEVQ